MRIDAGERRAGSFMAWYMYDCCSGISKIMILIMKERRRRKRIRVHDDGK